MPRPASAVALTITGRIRAPNVDQAAEFDMPMLARLPQTSFSTRTPWYASACRSTMPSGVT